MEASVGERDLETNGSPDSSTTLEGRDPAMIAASVDEMRRRTDTAQPTARSCGISGAFAPAIASTGSAGGS